MASSQKLAASSFEGNRDPSLRSGFQKQPHSNLISTISDCVPTRNGGPQVPAP